MTEAEALQQMAEQRAEIVKAIKGLLGVLAISWIGRVFIYAALNGQLDALSRRSRPVSSQAASSSSSSSASADFSPSGRSSSTDGPLFVPVHWTSGSSWSSDSSTSSCDSSSSDGGSCGGGE